jgi:nucleoside-triphosphatase THEP1
MVSICEKLVLWTGEKHSGKTTSAANLVKIARGEGFIVAGLMAPSIYNNDELHGFDAIDLRNENRVPLARRKTGQFTFLTNGLKFGNTALSKAATKSADLVIVDEFGPMELNGQLWRQSVDSLLTLSSSLILLVVRQELADEVQRVYKDFPCRNLAAIEPESINEVIRMLKNNRQLQRETK